MSSALTLVVLGQAYFLGGLPNTPPATPKLQPIPKIPDSPWYSPPEPLILKPDRSDYTYTPGVGLHKAYTELVDWKTARSQCVEDGGDLVVIDSVAELEAITRLLRPGSWNWIGLNDIDVEGKFVNVRDELLIESEFNAWDVSQPDDFRNEDCVILTSAGKMNDLACGNGQFFICELP